MLEERPAAFLCCAYGTSATGYAGWDEDAYLWSGTVQGPTGRIPLGIALEERGPITDEQVQGMYQFLEQEEAYRLMIADRMLELANDWQAEAEKALLTAPDPAGRMSLKELSVDQDAGVNAFYFDGGIFEGHRLLGVFDTEMNLIDVDLVG